MDQVDVKTRVAQQGDERFPQFDPSTLEALPPPAQRYLTWALPPGTPLVDAVQLAMDGELRAGRWMPFTAEQAIVAGRGFRWQPVVGRRLVRLTGADRYAPGVASVDFRLHGLVPVARSSGPDVDRSAVGRLAAETVAWLPQALTPQCGARWAPVDDRRADVTLDLNGQPTTVRVTVAPDGTPQAVALQRWNGDASPPHHEPFGGRFHGIHRTEAGVRIAGAGTVGWNWGTPAWEDDAFFRFTIASAHHLPSAAVDLDPPRPLPRRILDAAESVGAAITIAGELAASPLRRRRRLRWGATDEEVTRTLPGDDVIPSPRWQYTRAIGVDAPAGAVWPWLAQLGRQRAGFYSYTALENAVGCRLRPLEHLDWTRPPLTVGDEVALHPKAPPLPVLVAEPPHHLVLGGMASPTAGQVWGFHVLDRSPASCRLLIRGRGVNGPTLPERLFFGPLLMEPITFVMERKMLRTIKHLAESGPNTTILDGAPRTVIPEPP